MNRQSTERVTVLMPMRNAGAFVEEAMKSILAQTERDFTFLVIDDGSDDESIRIADRLADRRTRIIQDGNHLGVAARLNWGLDHANTRFVARMDADDISAPHRLSRQLAFMEANPHVGICGSWYKLFETGSSPSNMLLPLDHDRLRAMTLFSSPFAHPTVMFNLKHLDAAGLRYSEFENHAEDYDLWERACSEVILANIPEFLLYYRSHGAQVSQLCREQQREASERVRKRALLRLGVNPTPSELRLHCDYATDHDMHRFDRLRAAKAWLSRLETVAKGSGEPAIAAECAMRVRHLKKRIRQRAKSIIPAAIDNLGRLARSRK